jgi:hypothetical protein
MSISSLAAALPVDGRQSPTALAVARGTTRLLHSLGFSVISELPLASGRRADLVALGADGEVWTSRSAVDCRLSRRSEVDRLPAALRPAVLRHDARSAARFFPDVGLIMLPMPSARP